MEDVAINQFVQALQGKQATIILVYLLVRRAMTIDELEERTGLDNDTVRKAVKGLKAKGFLFMQRGEHGKQTWLPVGDTLIGQAFEGIQNPKISDSAALRSSSSRGEVSISSYLPQEQEEEPESEIFGFCLAALDAAGIREPKRSHLARLEHVTPELIRAHVEQVKREGMTLGTAIHRIEFNWEVDLPAAAGKGMSFTIDRGKRGVERVTYAPELVQAVADFTGHEAECRCMDCQIARSAGIQYLCSECRRYTCICEESESE